MTLCAVLDRLKSCARYEIGHKAIPPQGAFAYLVAMPTGEMHRGHVLREQWPDTHFAHYLAKQLFCDSDLDNLQMPRMTNNFMLPDGSMLSADRCCCRIGLGRRKDSFHQANPAILRSVSAH